MLLPVGSQSIKVAQCPHMENMNNDARPVTVESALVSADEVRTTHSEADRGKALKLGLGTRSTSAQQHSSRSSAPAGRPKEYLPAFLRNAPAAAGLFFLFSPPTGGPTASYSSSSVVGSIEQSAISGNSTCASILSRSETTCTSRLGTPATDGHLH